MSEIIRILTTSNFTIKCPNCSETFSAKQANLFDARVNFPPKIQKHINSIISNQRKLSLEYDRKIKKLSGQLKAFKTEKSLLKERIKKKPKRIHVVTKHVNIGQIIETILPGSKGFKFDQSDCRAIFDPIDYIAFNGLTKKKQVESITLIEVKSGEAKLQRSQKNIQYQIEQNKVNYFQY